MKERKTTMILVILLFGTFISFLNQTLMNVALPSIMNDFNIEASTGQWLTNGYLLINGIMVPVTAFLIDKFKTRQLYLTVAIVFTIGTLIGGLAPNFTVLIIGRMLQAAGAGVIGPLLTVVVMKIFPIEHRGAAMGLIGLAMNFAPAIGPTLSGWIVQSYSWKMLFFMIVPLMTINIIMAIFLLPNIGEPKDIHLDVASIIFSSLGLGSLLLGFSNAGAYGWLDIRVIGFILLGLVLVTIFVLRQLKLEEPVLDVRVLKSKMFTLSTITNFFMVMGMYGGMLLLPLFLQGVKLVKPMESGLVLLPGAISMAILSPITGKLFDKFGYRVLSICGLSILAIGTLPFGFITESSSLIHISFYQLVRCIGLAMVMMPIQTEAMNSLPQSAISHGNAMYNTIRQVAGSIGTATLITIMSKSSLNYTDSHSGATAIAAEIHGIHTSYFITFALTIVALIIIISVKVNKENKLVDE